MTGNTTAIWDIFTQLVNMYLVNLNLCERLCAPGRFPPPSCGCALLGKLFVVEPCIRTNSHILGAFSSLAQWGTWFLAYSQDSSVRRWQRLAVHCLSLPACTLRTHQPVNCNTTFICKELAQASGTPYKADQQCKGFYASYKPPSFSLWLDERWCVNIPTSFLVGWGGCKIHTL